MLLESYLFTQNEDQVLFLLQLLDFEHSLDHSAQQIMSVAVSRQAALKYTDISC